MRHLRKIEGKTKRGKLEETKIEGKTKRGKLEETGSEIKQYE